MVLMGGPIDTRANPTKVNHFAMAHSLEWPGGGERYGAEMPDHHGVGHLHCHLRQVGGRQRRRDGERRTDLRGDGRAIESHNARLQGEDVATPCRQAARLEPTRIPAALGVAE